MAGLVDIAAVTEKVTVAGTEIEVPGVSAAGIAILLTRFPELRKTFSGIEVSTKELLKVGPEALAAILAAGTGAPGDEAAEAVAAKLSVGRQTKILAAILRVTLPDGIDPFVEELDGLGLLLKSKPAAVSPGAAPSTKGRASKSRKRSSN